MALGIKGLFVLGVVGLSGLWEAVFADVGVALLAVLNATRTRTLRGKAGEREREEEKFSEEGEHPFPLPKPTLSSSKTFCVYRIPVQSFSC